MSRPPAMSTHSKPNVRTLAPTHITKSLVYTNLQCADPSPAAPPVYSRITPALPPMPVPPPLGSESCHKEHAAATVLRTICTRTPSFAHFLSKTDRNLTAAASCYETPCQYPVTKREKKIFQLGPSGQSKHFDTLSIPSRYPISQRNSQPVFESCGRSWAHSGLNWPHFCGRARPQFFQFFHWAVCSR